MRLTIIAASYVQSAMQPVFKPVFELYTKKENFYQDRGSNPGISR